MRTLTAHRDPVRVNDETDTGTPLGRRRQDGQRYPLQDTQTLGAPPHVISARLGHRNIGDQLTAGYSKTRYTEEAGEILQRVADKISGISKNPAMANEGLL